MSRYDDIIGLPHYELKRHRPMSAEARASQFAPFAALTNYDAAIRETARHTSARKDLSADELEELSRKLAYALSRSDNPILEITYFIADRQKDGGSYETVRSAVRKCEPVFNRLTLADGTEIELDAISEISSDIFDAEF